MYPITEAVMALFEAEHRKVLRITGTDKNGAAITITDDNVLVDSFQIDRYSCNGEKLEVGTAIAAQMTFSLENGDGVYDDIVFEDTELLAEVGVADWTQENPTVYWVPCGYFTPDMQPRRLTTISITALDRMAKFDVVVDATDLTFPTTIAGLVGQVCTVCGVTLAQSISALTNADVAVAALPSANGGMATYRNLIQWCAGIMGTNAWFDWNGLLRFSWYDNATNYVSTMDNRHSSDLYENDLTITGVEYTNDSGIVIVEGTDDYAIDLTGNAIAGPLIATVLPPLNTALNGFTYRPFTAAAINAPYLWPMDIVTFTDKGGSSHSSALTNVVFGLNGTTALESKGMTYAINKAAQPKGFTREQAQLVNQVVARDVASSIDDYLTQQEIFNRLTDNGAAQGLVLYDGQLYMNATYINAGELSVRLVNFRDYDPPYKVPNEFDPDSLLSGQTIEDGWIVGYGSSEVYVLECDNAVPLRGQTLEITVVTPNLVGMRGGWVNYTDEHGEEQEYIWDVDAPAYGAEDAEGNLNGATMDGEDYQYSFLYTVGRNENAFMLNVGGRKVRSIVVTDGISKNFGLRYGNNIGLNYKGLQVGKFVVDRSGNATFNGDAIFNGDVGFADPGAARNALDITPANIGAPSTNGTGATGTWGISVSGNAATATNADKVDGYHASDLWRKDGGTWNGNANISCVPTAASQEYSFNLGAGYAGTYWQVWSNKNSATILSCYNDTRYVYVPVHLAVGGYDDTGYALSAQNIRANGEIKSQGNFLRVLGGATRGANPSSNQYGTYEFRDSKNARLSQVEACVSTDGWNRLHLYVLGHHTSSDQYTGIIIQKQINNTGGVNMVYNANTGALSGATWNGNAIGVGYGGTGATTVTNARKNLDIHSGTTVATFSSGKVTLPFSTFGVSARPAALILTPQSTPGSMQYQFDESSSNVVIYGWNKTGGNWGGGIRFSWICIP